MGKKATQPHPSRFTKQDLADAAEDARDMIVNSVILQNLTANLITARRLYMVVRSAMDNEIHKGWEVDNPELIIQTLVLSAQEKANEKFKIADLQQAIFGTTVPFLDIIMQQVQETGADIDGTADFQSDEEKPDEPRDGED